MMRFVLIWDYNKKWLIVNSSSMNPRINEYAKENLIDVVNQIHYKDFLTHIALYIMLPNITYMVRITYELSTY